MKELAGEPRGLVRVTAPVALGRQQIVPHLPDFLRAHPGVHLELDLSDRLHSLTQEGFDLAIRHTTTAPQTHVAWKLCDTRSLLVASRDYLDARGAPRHPRELVDHSCLCYLRDNEPAAWSFELQGRRRDLDAGRLVSLLDGWRPSGAFGDHIFAIRPYSAVVPSAVRALVRHLRERLAGGFSGP